MKRLARSSYKRARNGSGWVDPPPAGLAWVATQARPLLSEQIEPNRFCYYKDGLSAAKPIGSHAFVQCKKRRPDRKPYVLYASAVIARMRPLWSRFCELTDLGPTARAAACRYCDAAKCGAGGADAAAH